MRVRGVQSGRPRVRIKSVVTTVLVLAIAIVLWTQRALVAQVIAAMGTGLIAPLVMAGVFESGRIVFHALAYTRSFRVIGADVPLRATIPAWFKAVFMNTVLPSGGTSGLAAVIDTARSRGVAVGSATSATLYTQTCFYTAMFLVILVGLTVMGFSGSLNVRDVLVSSVIGIAACAFLLLLGLGHFKPALLRRVMRRVEHVAASACATLRLKRPAPWADKLVTSYSKAASQLVKRPRESLLVFLTMVVAMSFDMLAFVACGHAFGITSLAALISGYVTALVFNSFNVTPGGVGVVEGLAAAVLAGYGYPGTLTLSMVLAYRAFMYWIPFAIGGVMMRVTGAFGSGGQAAADGADGVRPVNATRISLRERIYDIIASRADRRAIASTLVVTLAAVYEMVASALPRDETVIEMLRQYTGFAVSVDPTLVIVFAYLLMLCLPGLLVRDQGCWLLSIALLTALGTSSTLAGNGLAGTVLVVFALAVLVVWYASFTFHNFLRRIPRLLRVLAYGIALAVLYAVIGTELLRDGIIPEPDSQQVVWIGMLSLAGLPTGVEMTPRALWFAGSAHAVAIALVVAVAFVLAQLAAAWVRDYRRPERAAMREFNRAETRAARERKRNDRAERREDRKAEREERRRSK